MKGSILDAGGRALEGVLVWVKPSRPETSESFPDAGRVIDQRRHRFEPGFLAVRTGTSLIFRNQDPDLHLVHARGAANFHFSVPSGAEVKVNAREEGEILLFCDFHPEMGARIRVLPTPCFAIASAEGAFTLKEVPTGPGSLVAEWGERRLEQRIDLKPGACVETQMRFPEGAEGPRRRLRLARIALADAEERIQKLLASARARAEAGDRDGARRLLEEANQGAFQGFGFHTALRSSVSGREAEALRARLDDLRACLSAPKALDLPSRFDEAAAEIAAAARKLRAQDCTVLEFHEWVEEPTVPPASSKAADR